MTTYWTVPAKPEAIQAFNFTGQPRHKWPTWLQVKFKEIDPKRVGHYAAADAAGEFWRWFEPAEFESRFSLTHGGDAMVDEPVFRIRAQDFCAVEAVIGYADIVQKYKGSNDVVRSARETAGRIRAWQAVNGSKMPDLPGSTAPARTIGPEPRHAEGE